ncbi:MAG: phosphatase PAP2 family protein [Clostridia bacterium]|nr:phosphatase PAP2 family protein [Clostridia bacterium]
MGKIDRRFLTNIILTSVALIGFLAIMILVLCDYNFKIDKFNVVVSNNRNGFWTGFFKIFTHLGSFYTLAVLAIVGVILIWFIMKNKRMSVFYAGTFAIVCISNFVLKQIVRRIRPEHLMIIEETGFSFPSGHAMMTFAFFALVIHFVWKTIKNKPLKITLISVLSVVIALIGFSRIYLGVHYLTDIIAGLLISYVIVSVCLMVYNTKWFKFLKDKGVKHEKEN